MKLRISIVATLLLLTLLGGSFAYWKVWPAAKFWPKPGDEVSSHSDRSGRAGPLPAFEIHDGQHVHLRLVARPAPGTWFFLIYLPPQPDLQLRFTNSERPENEDPSEREAQTMVTYMLPEIYRGKTVSLTVFAEPWQESARMGCAIFDDQGTATTHAQSTRGHNLTWLSQSLQKNWEVSSMNQTQVFSPTQPQHLINVEDQGREFNVWLEAVSQPDKSRGNTAANDQ